jgi:RNA polymerase sigma-70 factor (ECF subfamily)
MSILINRCRTAVGARRRREARVVSDDAAVALAASTSSETDADLRDALERALARLDDVHREAFLLKHVEALGYDEMSAMTGAGVSALKMRVRRACERLQVLLEEDRRG